jgi:transposase
MGKKYLSMVAKARIVTLHHEGISLAERGWHLQISKNTASIWVKQAKNGDWEATLRKEEGTGRVRKTSKHTDNLLRRIMMARPLITAKEIKIKNQELLKDVSIRTIQEWLNDHLGLPVFCAVKKLMLTAVMAHDG